MTLTHPLNTILNNKRIAFVQSCWHNDIVNQGKIGFLEKIAEFGISSDQVDCIELPGAFEIPLKCKQLSETRQYAAIIAAGFVVDGGIYRHEFVAQAVISGLMQVQLELQTPILSMVLTPKDFEESDHVIEYFLEHLRLKGHEVADALKSIMESQ